MHKSVAHSLIYECGDQSIGVPSRTPVVVVLALSLRSSIIIIISNSITILHLLAFYMLFHFSFDHRSELHLDIVELAIFISRQKY